MSKKDKAEAYFSEGLNCAQSVLLAFSREQGLDPDIASAVSAGFGGGMGRTQKTCGAVTGAVMVIGYWYYDKGDLPASREKIRQKTWEFIKKFEDKHGNSDCRILLDADLGTEEGRARYDKENMSELKCLVYIKDACDILEQVL